MKKNRTCLGIVFLASILFCAIPAAAQSRTSGSAQADIYPGRHRGAITALLQDENGRILSAGEDGFLEIWNNRAAEERFQLSPYAIKSMVLRPGKPQITVIESDGLSLYRISAWDYETKRNLFTLRFRDSVSYINYSAAGSFLIVARSGRTGVAFIQAETGEVLESPEDLAGAVSLAATGRSERIMVCYLSSGILSYWDLESGKEVQRFVVPPNISSPVLFGNSRFLAGFDTLGLLVLDAVTGTTLARDDYLRQGVVFIDNSDSPESAQSSASVKFNCLSSSGRTNTVYRMEMNTSGRLSTTSRMVVPSQVPELSSAASADGDNIILGTSQGNLWLLSRTGARIMATGNPEGIIDAAVSSSSIAFLTERGAVGYIPLDYSLFENSGAVTAESAADTYGSGAYTSVTSEPSILAAGNGVSQFLLWQPGVNRSIPLLKTISAMPTETTNANGFSGSQLFFDKLSQRFPLRSAAVMGNSVLFLDTAGTASILNRETGEQGFSYSAAGAVDAAFIDQNTIIIGRSAATGNTPFMIVNSSTGETVPLAYPAMVGIRVYRGLSGAIYGAVVNQSAGNMQTSIIRLNMSNPAQSEKLIDYNGEDSSFTMAESGGNLASTLGGGGATLYQSSRSQAQGAPPAIVPFERSMGLPVKILDGGGRWFIVLDGEGGITWHDNRTGKLLAVLRFYQDPRSPLTDSWVLERDGNIIRGRTEKR